MSDTKSRLTNIATDINNYFDNEIFDEFQIEVDWWECPDGQYSFDIAIGDEVILIEDISLTLTDQEIKKMITDVIFETLYELGFLGKDGSLRSERLKISVKISNLFQEVLELLPKPIRGLILKVIEWWQREK